MKPNTNGQAQPDLIKEAQEAPKTKTRTYKKPDGTEFSLTEEQFANVVEIFKDLRRVRDEKSTQLDGIDNVRKRASLQGNIQKMDLVLM